MGRLGLAIWLAISGAAACGGGEEVVEQPQRGSCDLHTGYAGDEYCLPPPPADKGFQLHIGPTDYAHPEPEFLLQPNEEVTTQFTTVSGNDRPVYFYYR